MSDTLLLQQVYTDSEYIRLIDLAHARHSAYCRKFDIDYQVHVCGSPDEPRGGGSWEKLRVIKGLLKRYKLIAYLDADAYIEDLTVDLRTVPNPPDTIGMVWFLVWKPHWNVGVMYFRPGKRVARFLDKWLSGYPGEPPWKEQQVLQEIAADPGAPVCAIPDEWNSSLDHNWKEHRIVSAFHGCGYRYETMAGWLQKARDANAGAEAPEVRA